MPDPQPRRLALGARLALATALGMALVAAAMGALAYVTVRHQVLGSVDATLRQQSAGAMARLASNDQDHELDDALPPELTTTRLGQPGTFLQLLYSSGGVVAGATVTRTIPPSPATLAIARAGSGAQLATLRVDDQLIRVLTTGLRPGQALQVAATITSTEENLDRVRTLLALGILAAMALAGLLGWLVARTALRPVRRLTRAAETVAATQDLTLRIDEVGTDELGRLAVSMNAMIAALDESLGAQRQLVADASHELRTPLTSLRMDIELLARGDRLPADERDQVLADVVAGTVEMSRLVDDLMELARDGMPIEDPEPVALDDLVAAEVTRASRHWREVTFTSDLDDSAALGSPSRLSRAVGNLLDNAGKFSPPGGEVTARLRAGELVITDQGPGIPAEDLTHVFDRFYRSTQARSRPGSGLGLAIVRQVAEEHGGDVSASGLPGGGAELRLRLPVITPHVQRRRRAVIHNRSAG
ncbi:MAG: sensor histidine kinase [Actinomycetes bacterium]